MLFRIIKNTVAAGAIAKIGQVLDLDLAEGKKLIGYGKAVAHAMESNPKKSEVIETRPVELETREPVMRGRKKR